MKPAFCLALLLLLPATAHAARPQEGPPLSAEELDAQVGGFKTPGGMEIGFGAVVSTYVDGQLALQTQLTWTEHGAVTTGDGAPVGDLPGAGVYLPGQNGGTTIVHDLTGAHIGSLVFNTADNRDIRTDTAITLAIPDFEQMQRTIAGQQLDMRLQDVVGRALTDAID